MLITKYSPEPEIFESSTTGEQASKSWNEFFNSDSYLNHLDKMMSDFAVREIDAAEFIYGMFIKGWIAGVNSHE